MDVELVAGEKRLSEVKDPDVFKKRLKEKKRRQWLEKPLHRRFLRYRKSEHRKNMEMVEGRIFQERN